MANIRVLLVDGFNLIRRVYEANHREDTEIDDCIESCVRSLNRALNTHRPSHAMVVIDSHDKTWRHMLYADYKLGRKPTPELLINHLDRFQNAFETAGVKSLEVAGYEADDVIATLATGVAQSSGDALIVSTDKGFLSLLNEHIKVYHHFDQYFYTLAGVKQKYGLRHDQLIDYWSLCGDPSNNIKGVPGIGKKTTLLLLEQFKSLDEVLRQARLLVKAQAADVPPAIEQGWEVFQKPLSKIMPFENEALKCRLLLTPKLDVELGINLRTFRLA